MSDIVIFEAFQIEAALSGVTVSLLCAFKAYSRVLSGHWKKFDTIEYLVLPWLFWACAMPVLYWIWRNDAYAVLVFLILAAFLGVCAVSAPLAVILLIAFAYLWGGISFISQACFIAFMLTPTGYQVGYWIGRWKAKNQSNQDNVLTL